MCVVSSKDRPFRSFWVSLIDRVDTTFALCQSSGWLHVKSLRFQNFGATKLEINTQFVPSTSKMPLTIVPTTPRDH